MALATGKRKREDASKKQTPVKKPALQAVATSKSPASDTRKLKTPAASDANGDTKTGPLHIQIVTGSYERVLHGISASIPHAALYPESTSTIDEKTTFQDTFLFAAHASAIRCLALSPSGEDADKCLLATGSSDERINVYSLSTAPPSASANPSLPSLSGVTTAENPRNRSLGSLIHHDRAITRLHFPTKSKLFSAAEDATISISRTRDWTVLSSIKAPVPKPQGRPSGDTAGPGEIPAGVNDFAIHPSQKLMLSVGRGEKCMRLWNLMTAKKAGVLNFDRELLAQAGEGKFASGEGRRVLWDEKGENYVVGFERGFVFFGIDSKPRAAVSLSQRSKIHQMRFLLGGFDRSILALSTEDGKIMFFDASAIEELADAKKLPQLSCLAQVGGKEAGISGRVKDFDILKSPSEEARLLIVAGSSDGAVRIWSLLLHDLLEDRADDTGKPPKQVGSLIATQETGDRITCLGAFILDGATIPDASDDAAEQMAGADINGHSGEDSEDSE